MKTKTIKKAKSKTNYKHKLEFITDKYGSKTKVIIPVKLYEEILEDLHDLAVVAERKNDRTIKLETVIRELKRDGLL